MTDAKYAKAISPAGISCGAETVKKGPRRPFLTIKSPGRERPMGTGAALRASVVRQRRTIRHCAPRNVFSATYTPPPKMIAVPFAPIGRETLRGFFDKLSPAGISCGADSIFCFTRSRRGRPRGSAPLRRRAPGGPSPRPGTARTRRCPSRSSRRPARRYPAARA